MSSNKTVANAVGASTARACDSCLKKRARFYCTADDAFLCQPCDSAVHTANPLAHRHERVRLKSASIKSLNLTLKDKPSLPSWHRGFTKKARTPRHGKVGEKGRTHVAHPFVPEIGLDDISLSNEDTGNEEEHLLYRVPIFDPFVAEMCTSTLPVTDEARPTSPSTPTGNKNEQNLMAGEELKSCFGICKTLTGLVPSDIELAEFSADVESLLGKGLENESFAMEGLGLVEYSHHQKVKIEADEPKKFEEVKEYQEVDDMERDPPFQFTFDYDYDESPATCGADEEKVAMVMSDDGKRELKRSSSSFSNGDCEMKDVDVVKKKRILKLDYDAVITAWASHGSPWTTGNRPELDSKDCWPDCMGNCATSLPHTYEDPTGPGLQQAAGDGGREARVSRYREKRRTRLFSKKIRYEVRKLNAEKRPRMKGRFVKRASFAGPGGFPLLTK